MELTFRKDHRAKKKKKKKSYFAFDKFVPVVVGEGASKERKEKVVVTWRNF